ncbi:MAG: DUF4249 domain-containing protein [Fluviicola sp.]|jgi:hypothetical protein|nr:DUF4249 domain-containing protein [Fluviicola sp.]
MKRAIIFICVLTLIVLGSCQKVIDVDLNSEDPKFVIEGNIHEGDTTHYVLITRSLNFDESIAYPTVNNAIVTVVDNLGNVGTFTSIGNGKYALSSYPGVVGRTYTITVAVDGNTFSASSTLQTAVPLNDVFIQELYFGQDTFRTIIAERNDPAGEPNYYQFNLYVNGVREKGIYLQDDQFNDGNLTLQPLFGPDLLPGDTLRLDMFCIDKPVYSYFYQLSLNSSGQATPANPVSNFPSGCFGYFGARTFASKTIVVP